MSLNDIWEAASGSPFHPVIPKEQQFLVGFTLLLVGACLVVIFQLTLPASLTSQTSIPFDGTLWAK